LILKKIKKKKKSIAHHLLQDAKKLKGVINSCWATP